MKNKRVGTGVYACEHCHCVTTYVVLCSRCLANRITAGYFDSAMPHRLAALQQEARSTGNTPRRRVAA